MIWFWLACQNADTLPQEVSPQGPLEVWTLSYPVHGLAQRIGGEEINLRVLLPGGQDAAEWWPTPAQITQLAQADLVFANGADYEGWIKTASLPTGLVVSAAQGFSAIVLEGQTHSHGKSGAHSHAGIDPHVWMDPDIYRLQAQQVTLSLKDRDPANAERHQSRFEGVSAELDQIIKESIPVMDQLKDYAIASNHPAFNYWMRRFDLNIHSFDIPPDESVDASDVLAAQAWIKANPKTIFFWEDPPSEALRSALAGTNHLVMDNLEGASSGQAYDYMAQYRANLDQIQQFYASEAKGTADVP